MTDSCTQCPSAPGSTKQEERRHLAASNRFVEMLLSMRRNAHGGLAFLEGLNAIFKVGPGGARRRTCEGELEGRDKLVGAADETLFQLEKLSVHIIDVAKSCQTSPDAVNYEKLSAVVEADVTSATASTRANTKAAQVWDKLAHKVPVEQSEERGAERVLSPAELFVHLPLTMYVHNTLHLYEMLGRLNSEVARGCKNATGVGVNKPLSLQLKTVLDQKGQPYSWLVFALIAALQILFQARDKLRAVAPPTKLREYPLALLASNPVFGPKQNPTVNWTASDEEGLMFRGLWVGPSIDEHRARHTYAFNSWSRSLPSCLFVLDFYGKCLPIAQAPDWHILLLIGRKWSQSPWVLPVQFFGGPDVGEAEKELMVPPFMSLKFEEDLELRSGMPLAELQDRSYALARRWELKIDRRHRSSAGTPLVKNPLGSLGEIVGPELSQLLQRKPGLVSNEWDEKATPTCAPKVTVRFVSQMELQPALRGLFEDETKQLLAFPPAPSQP